MAIDKAVQIGVAAEAGKEIELEVKDEQNPEEDVSIEVNDDGSVDINLGKEEFDSPFKGEFDQNLAEVIDIDLQAQMSDDLVGLFEADDNSRSEWKQTYEDGLELLGLKIEERTERQIVTGKQININNLS